jgi:hypothetical protein
MSYEKKIKDLLGRLVAMSPEPPPYPEEMSVTSKQTTRRRRPALVFVGAAALVAALAVPVILLTMGQEPDAIATTTTQAVATTSTTVQPSTTTTMVPSTSTTSLPVPITWSGVVYLYQEPENSFVGSPALVPLILEVNGPLGGDTEFTQALAAVGDSLPEGFSNAIPADVVLQSMSSDGEVITADMSETFVDGAGGLLADYTMLNQLIYSLTHQGLEDLSVLFTVGGEPVETFGFEGLDLSSPVGRGDFLDHLHVINLTSPIVASDGEYQLSGFANVFEATVSVAVLDATGEVVHEEFVTTTCGTGCWGEFSTEIAADLIVPGESSIRVFTHSAEDGSVTDAITVPIPEGDVWELTIG